MYQGVSPSLGRGTAAPIGEVMDYTYYDSLLLAAAGTDFSLFQVPIGGGAVPKTSAQTNMISSGVIPQNQHLVVRAIRAEYLSAGVKASADIDTLYTWLQSVVVRVFISGKDALFYKPLTEIFGIPMLLHVTPTVAGDTELIAAMGRFLGVNPLNIPITLAALTTFEVRISYPTALGGAAIVGDSLRIGLSGVLTRAS